MESKTWARSCARVLWVAGLLCGVSLPEHARAEAPLTTADACVSFSSEPGDKRIVVSASNDCKRRLACSLDYTVRCTDTRGKETRKLDGHAPFLLLAKGNATVTLSAETCSQGWAIDDFTWSCG